MLETIYLRINTLASNKEFLYKCENYRKLEELIRSNIMQASNVIMINGSKKIDTQVFSQDANFEEILNLVRLSTKVYCYYKDVTDLLIKNEIMCGILDAKSRYMKYNEDLQFEKLNYVDDTFKRNETEMTDKIKHIFKYMKVKTPEICIVNEDSVGYCEYSPIISYVKDIIYNETYDYLENAKKKNPIFGANNI